MNRLGIIACQVYEKELAYLLDNDKKIKQLYARRTEENLLFSSYLNAREIKFISDYEELEEHAELDAIIEVMPIGLHVYIDELIEKRRDIIDRVKPHADRVLMFYGLCGDSMQKVFDREDVKIFAPRDNGEIVDDCICSILGKKEYLWQLKNIGSFFMIPGFALHSDDLTEKTMGPGKHFDEIKMLLDAAGYKRYMMIDHDLWSDEEISIAKEQSKQVGLPMEHIKGDLKILMSCLDEAIDSF